MGLFDFLKAGRPLTKGCRVGLRLHFLSLAVLVRRTTSIYIHPWPCPDAHTDTHSTDCSIWITKVADNKTEIFCDLRSIRANCH